MATRAVGFCALSLISQPALNLIFVISVRRCCAEHSLRNVAAGFHLSTALPTSPPLGLSSRSSSWRLRQVRALSQNCFMHTAMVIGLGLLVLGVGALTGRLLGGVAALPQALLLFLPVWFLSAGINMYLGIKRAGYSFADEAPIFLIVFAVPAALALALWWRLR
jgi:hypothetical protein